MGGAIQIPDFTLFDILLIVILMLAALRGFSRGLTKEIFSFGGFVLGLFFGSRLKSDALDLVNTYLFHIDKTETTLWIGYLSIFLMVWLTAVMLGAIFGKLEAANGLSFVNRCLGCLTGGAKILIILSFLMVLLTNTIIDKQKLSYFTDGSLLYPYIESTGAKIMALNSSKGRSQNQHVVYIGTHTQATKISKNKESNVTLTVIDDNSSK